MRKYSYIKCPKCNREMEKRGDGYKRHIVKCDGKAKEPPAFTKEDFWTGEGCKVCGKSFANIKTCLSHYWRMHTEEGKTHKPMKNTIPWNKGKTLTDPRVKLGTQKAQKILAEKRKLGLIKKSKPTEAFLRELSIRQTLHTKGGFCKWYWVDGQHVQGTWERDIAKQMSKLYIPWRKLAMIKDIIEYVDDGIIKRYTPDFAVGKYLLEIKGYWRDTKTKRKMALVYEQHKKLKGKLLIIPKERFLALKETRSKKEFLSLLREYAADKIMPL